MITTAPIHHQNKIYVEVNVKFFSDGRIMPLCIIWRDGKTFNIDRVTDVRRSASFDAGGLGLRYTCIIEGHTSFLFYEGNNQWFVEGRS